MLCSILLMQCTVHVPLISIIPCRYSCCATSRRGILIPLPLAQAHDEGRPQCGVPPRSLCGRARAILLHPIIVPLSKQLALHCHHPSTLACSILHRFTNTSNLTSCLPHQQLVCSARQLALLRAPSSAHARPMLSTSSHAVSYPPSEP